MGLKHPTDLTAWQAWQRRSSVARWLKSSLRRDRSTLNFLVGHRGALPAAVVIALDTLASSSWLSLAAPLEHLGDAEVALLVPSVSDVARFGDGWSWEPWEGDLGAVVRRGGVTLASGHYLPLGAAVFAQAADLDARFVTVQHGLMTPLAPPLAPETHLLAWSDSDAAFWGSERTDVTHTVVGSQLLWNADQEKTHVSRFERPVFLGQLHGAELPRAGLTLAATRFCRQTGATYRPHPGERDALSRAQHAVWERMGIEIDRSGLPLSKLDRPVVASFSTGVLEAAARGIPAWAYYPNPPAWLADFWDRYGMHRWGAPPTPAPAVPKTSPAEAVANWIKEQV